MILIARDLISMGIDLGMGLGTLDGPRREHHAVPHAEPDEYQTSHESRERGTEVLG